MTDSLGPFAAKLYHLGFEPFNPKDDKREVSLIKARYLLSEEVAPPKISPLEAKKVFRPLAENEPCFMSMEFGNKLGGLTIAYDETGQAWRILKCVDLEPYGFTHVGKAVLPN
ncbi:MAG: hypothetical protein JWN64_630 [Parcubacteria group bacterium]|nr:hypothetical protein [Parcubacteria group bacterium]